MHVILTALAIASALAGGAQVQHPEALSLVDRPLYTVRPRGDDGRRIEAAIAAAREAVAKDPQSADAGYALGQADEAGGRLLDAIDAYTLAIERHPEDTRLIFARGRLLVVIRKFDVALRDLRKAAETLPEARCRVAFVTYLKGEFAAAHQAFEQCPESPWAQVTDVRTGAIPPLEGGSTDEMMSAYLRTLPALIAKNTSRSRDQLTKILDKYEKRWMEDAYIAAEADLARLPKKGKKTKKK